MTAPILPPTDANITIAVEILHAGGLVAMPTETVYGLACDAANPEAVAKLYAAKGRPSFNPLIAHVLDLATASKIGHMSHTALKLAARGWPGPLTLVLPLLDAGKVCDLARAGLKSIAVRQTAHPVAQQLLNRFTQPLVAPSANPSGKISPTTADHVAADMGDKIDLILDGGPCAVGVESTIISCLTEPPTLLRPGAFVAASYAATTQDEAQPLAPGALSRHYAPNATLRLNALSPVEGDAYLAFGPFEAYPDQLHMNLSTTGNLTEAAANMFAMLRALDTVATRIAVAPIPRVGLGLAINDRLARAAKRD
jgi:L-threonylcarbamoyladenylate synthase